LALGVVVPIALLAACTAPASTPGPAADGAGEAGSALEPVEPVEPPATSAAVEPVEPAGAAPAGAAPDPFVGVDGAAVTLVGSTGAIGLVDPVAGTVTRLRDEHWSHRVSLDRTYAVSTVVVGPGDTKVAWDSLPSGDVLGGTVLRGDDYRATATQVDGTLTAFVDAAEPVVDGHLAGAHAQSTIVLASPAGEQWRTTLAGNYVPEAFSRATDPAGMPSEVYLLEYFPATAPTFYRVRVLSTATGEVALPLNLRNKVQQVDERMAGISRSQVVASDHGLLFTLYRGTIDGTPDGDPYAFVHTLDFEGGVWCLDVDPSLALDVLPGSLAVGGDRLYVASANGLVGSFPIPSITDGDLSPFMDWTTRVSPGDDDAPPIAANADGVYVAPPGITGSIAHVLPSSEAAAPGLLKMPPATALALDDNGDLMAIGDDWSTIGVDTVPDWLGEVTAIVIP
jgi:hypothetical protein